MNERVGIFFVADANREFHLLLVCYIKNVLIWLGPAYTFRRRCRFVGGNFNLCQDLVKYACVALVSSYFGIDWVLKSDRNS